MANVGQWFNDTFGFDPTPGFNLGWNNNSPLGGVTPTITDTGRNPRTGQYDPGYGPDSDQGSEDTPANEDTPESLSDTQTNTSEVGAGGSGPGGGMNLAALAQLGQSASIIQNALDRLPNQLDIARGNINRQYSIGINELNSQRSANQNNFNTSTLQNQQGFRTNKNVINDQASQGLRGLSRILGSYGAVGSDMGLAGQAVSDYASAQNAGAGQNYSQNQQALDTNWGNYRNQWDNEKRKRDDWKSQQMNQAEAQSSSTRQDLLSRLAAIRGEEAAARGGSYAGAAQPYIDQANQLSGRIDELGRINPTYTGNTPVYNAPSLGSYSAGNGAVTALQERVQGGMNTPYLNALLGRDRERKIGL